MSLSSRASFKIAGLALAFATLPAACSLLTSNDLEQCASPDDCARKAEANPALLGSTCIEGYCTTPVTQTTTGGGGDPTGCVSSAQCTSDNNGVPSICPEPGEACVQLLNEDCTEVIGDYQHPEALIIGLHNSSPFGPLPDQFFHSSILCAAEQVVNELESSAGGIPTPSGVGTRPVAFVSCNEKPDLERSGLHLIDTVGVTTMIGPAFASNIQFAANVSVAKENVLTLGASFGLAGYLDLMSDNRLWTTVPNYGHSTLSLGKLLTAADTWIREDDPTTTNIRVAIYANQDPDTQMAQYGIDTDRFVFNGKPAAEQTEPDGPECPNGCFRYWTSSQFEDMNGDINFGEIISTMAEFNPHVIISIDGDSGFTTSAFPALENIDTAKPDPIVLTRLPDPTTPIFLQGLLSQEPPKPGVQSRFFSIDYRNENPDIFNQFAVNFGAICPNMVPPNQPFFPPFIEHWYDAMWLAILANLANGNHAIPTKELTGQQLAAGLLALSPVGQTDPATAQQIEIKPNTIANILNQLVLGNEVDVVGSSGGLDFDPAWKSPTMDMKVVCIEEGDDFPTTARWVDANAYWDNETDAFIPGESYSNFGCLPLEL